MKRLLCLLICVLSLSAHAQIANPDFENWYTDSSGISRLNGWEHLIRYNYPNTTLPGTWKDSASEHGLYALRLSRWYNYTWDVIRQNSAINFRPAALSGYYKYTDNLLSSGRTLDTALLELYVTSWNTALNRRDTIGTGLKELSLSTNYTRFVCPVIYTALGSPDSILIRFQPSKFNTGGVGVCANSPLCSFLTIDNLSLDASTQVQSLSKNHVVLFPNPASSILTGNFMGTGICSVSVTDAVGRQIYLAPAVENSMQIDIRSWCNGVYFLRIDGKAYTETVKVIKE